MMTALPARSVPSVAAEKAVSGTTDEISRTLESARSRSNSYSSAFGCWALGTFQSLKGMHDSLRGRL